MINFTNKSPKILVIGDLMIDQYLWGSCERVSPEAPVPIINVTQDSEVLGGAGNVVNNLKKLGADVLEFTPNWKVVKNLMLESFKRKGDFCWHCHTGIYSYPIRVAIKFKVPLVIYGEPLAEMSAYYS